MCDYCKDYCEWKERITPHKDIIKEEIDVKLGPVEFEASAEVGIYAADTDPVMSLMIFLGDFEPLVDKEVPINFCPMCGQKLR